MQSFDAQISNVLSNVIEAVKQDLNRNEDFIKWVAKEHFKEESPKHRSYSWIASLIAIQ